MASELEIVINKLNPEAYEPKIKVLKINKGPNFSLIAFLGNDSIFIPFHTCKNGGDVLLQTVVDMNIKSLNLDSDNESAYGKISKELGILINGEQSGLKSDIQNLSQTTGIHLFSTPINNQDDLLNLAKSILNANEVSVSVLA